MGREKIPSPGSQVKRSTRQSSARDTWTLNTSPTKRALCPNWPSDWSPGMSSSLWEPEISIKLEKALLRLWHEHRLTLREDAWARSLRFKAATHQKLL